jgi:hypothetical protein
MAGVDRNVESALFVFGMMDSGLGATGSAPRTHHPRCLAQGMRLARRTSVLSDWHAIARQNLSGHVE